jgi:hypothetical protein
MGHNKKAELMKDTLTGQVCAVARMIDSVGRDEGPLGLGASPAGRWIIYEGPTKIPTEGPMKGICVAVTVAETPVEKRTRLRQELEAIDAQLAAEESETEEAPEEKEPEAPDASEEDTRLQTIVNAIEEVVEFTPEGKPDELALASILDFPITTEERDDAWLIYSER